MTHRLQAHWGLIILSLVSGCTYYRTPQRSSVMSQLEQMCSDATLSCSSGINPNGFNSLSSGSDGLTQNTPLVICSEDQLNRISVSDSETGWAFENLNKNYILGGDLKLSRNFQGILAPRADVYLKEWNRYQELQSVLSIRALTDGAADSPVGFQGTFQGCNRTLSGIRFSAETRKIIDSNFTQNFMGLFNVLEPGAMISNLVIDDTTIEDGIDHNGILAGYATDAFSSLTGATGKITLENITIQNSEINPAVVNNGLLLGHVTFVDQGSIEINKINIINSKIVGFLNSSTQPEIFQEWFLRELRETYYISSSRFNSGLIGNYTDYGTGSSSVKNIELKNLEFNSIDNPYFDFGSFGTGLLFGQVVLGKTAKLSISDATLENAAMTLEPVSSAIGSIAGYLVQSDSSQLSISNIRYSGSINADTTWGVGAFGYTELYGDENSVFNLSQIHLNGVFSDSHACGAVASYFGAIYTGYAQTLNMSDLDSSSLIRCGLQNPSSNWTPYAVGSTFGEAMFEEDFNLNLNRIYSGDQISVYSTWGVGMFGTSYFYSNSNLSNILFDGSIRAQTNPLASISDYGGNSSGAVGAAFGYFEATDEYDGVPTNFKMEKAIFRGKISLGENSYDFGGLIGETDTSFSGTDSQITFENILLQYQLDVDEGFSGGLGALVSYLSNAKYIAFKNIISDIDANVKATSAGNFGYFGLGIPTGDATAPMIQDCYYGLEGWFQNPLLELGFKIYDGDSGLGVNQEDLVSSKIYYNFDRNLWSISGSSTPTMPSVEDLKP